MGNKQWESDGFLLFTIWVTQGSCHQPHKTGLMTATKAHNHMGASLRRRFVQPSHFRHKFHLPYTLARANSNNPLISKTIVPPVEVVALPYVDPHHVGTLQKQPHV
jgi:hypothetical protein